MQTINNKTVKRCKLMKIGARAKKRCDDDDDGGGGNSVAQNASRCAQDLKESTVSVLNLEPEQCHDDDDDHAL